MLCCQPVDDEASFRERPRAQDKTGGGFDHRRQLVSRVIEGGVVYSGETEPRLMMYLMPSATDMSSLVTLSSGTTTRKPLVGLGVVGTKTQTTFSFVFV